MLGAQLAVVFHVTASLAHEPHRRIGSRLAAAGGEKRMLDCIHKMSFGMKRMERSGMSEMKNPHEI